MLLVLLLLEVEHAPKRVSARSLWETRPCPPSLKAMIAVAVTQALALAGFAGA